MGQKQSLFGQGYHFYLPQRHAAAIVSGRNRGDPHQTTFFQVAEIRLQSLVVTAVDRPGNIRDGENPEPSGFGEQSLFFRAKTETANVEGNAIACAARTVLPPASSFPWLALGLRRTFRPRFSVVMRAVFPSALLKPFHATG
jgi:hypothetical protein